MYQFRIPSQLNSQTSWTFTSEIVLFLQLFNSHGRVLHDVNISDLYFLAHVKVITGKVTTAIMAIKFLQTSDDNVSSVKNYVGIWAA